MEPSLILVGASVRAAAFSAIRAGLRPWAIDLFADQDLAAVCPAQKVSARGYPAALRELVREAPPGPWMYTGALENWPDVIEQIASDRPLWGNRAECLRRVRDPFAVTATFRSAQLPCPVVRRPGDLSTDHRWLVKPLASGGGVGIQFATDHLKRSVRPGRRVYAQEFMDGEPRSGIYVADADGCRMLGVTQQLIGEKWLHAGPFRYAGSIGPLAMSVIERTGWEKLGTMIAAWAGLRGLFGIDAVIRNGVPWPVEVNPRYTASVEVIEYGSGVLALGEVGRKMSIGTVAPRVIDRGLNGVVGKAIWFAPRAITIPRNVPWETTWPPASDTLPAFADIPSAGQRIAAGRPVVTMFATGTTITACRHRLRNIAGEVDAWLLG